MKTILLLTSEFPPLPGGIGNHAYHLCMGYSQAGYRVTVVTDYRFQGDEVEKEDTFDQKIPATIIRIPNKSLKPLQYLHRIWICYQLAKKLQPEYFIVSGQFPLWVGGLFTVLSGTLKTMGIIHGSEIKAGGKLKQWCTRQSLNRIKLRVAVSNYTKMKVLEVCNKPVHVINNGFNILAKPLLPKPSLEHLQLITVGSVTSRKGQENMVKALPYLIQTFPKVTYHLVGIPAEAPSLVELAQKLQVMDAIVIHGALEEKEKLALLNRCHIFCMLSNHLSNGDFEGFGIAVLEANALGLPAIGSMNSGIADAIKHHYSGILVDPKNAEEVAEAIQHICAQYSSYSEQAIAHCEKFKWPQIMKLYLALPEK